MSGKGEERPRARAHGDQVLDRSGGRLADREAIDREAQRRQRLGQHIEHRATRRRDAGRGEQPLEQVNRIGHAATGGCSNCSITQSSSCASAIHCCMKGWVITAWQYGPANRATGS